MRESVYVILICPDKTAGESRQERYQTSQRGQAGRQDRKSALHPLFSALFIYQENNREDIVIAGDSRGEYREDTGSYLLHFPQGK